ncbi:MAG TPA: hypothetical protein GXX57_04425 [Firmicutes bacterium]|nr:hypothetical protein [Bacillota bacterium]
MDIRLAQVEERWVILTDEAFVDAMLGGAPSLLADEESLMWLHIRGFVP